MYTPDDRAACTGAVKKAIDAAVSEALEKERQSRVIAGQPMSEKFFARILRCQKDNPMAPWPAAMGDAMVAEIIFLRSILADATTDYPGWQQVRLKAWNDALDKAATTVNFERDRIAILALKEPEPQ